MKNLLVRPNQTYEQEEAESRSRKLSVILKALGTEYDEVSWDDFIASIPKCPEKPDRLITFDESGPMPSLDAIRQAFGRLNTSDKIKALRLRENQQEQH